MLGSSWQAGPPAGMSLCCPSSWDQFPRKRMWGKHGPSPHLLWPSQRDREKPNARNQVTGREVSLFADRCKGTHEMQGQAGHQGAAMPQATPASVKLGETVTHPSGSRRPGSNSGVGDKQGRGPALTAGASAASGGHG